MGQLWRTEAEVLDWHAQSLGRLCEHHWPLLLQMRSGLVPGLGILQLRSRHWKTFQKWDGNLRGHDEGWRQLLERA